jgi:hypothetical protein
MLVAEPSRRSVAGLGMAFALASCGGETRQSGACDLGQRIKEQLGDVDALDCGELVEDASVQQRSAARDCVLAAFHAKSSVQARGEAGRRRPWLGGRLCVRGGDALVSILHYDPGPIEGRKRPRMITGQACSALGELDDCDLSPSQELCLSCVQPIEQSLACQAPVEQGGCRAAGNYQAGKEGSYQPCCPGLSEVFQKSKLEINGAPTCGDLPLRVYACIEGSCGDGRCEAPENVPCGCKLDCPDVTPAP